jgi:hypothetical protein
LFAAKRAARDPWNIYEMAVDGSGVRQITRALGDCRSPGYQSSQYVITVDEPWYQISFVRIDRGARNEAGTGAVSSLHSCKLDGSQVQRLTYNLSSDFDPAILWDGRLVFASWRRCDFERGELGRVGLFAGYTDGADCEAFCLEAGRPIKHMPCPTAGGAGGVVVFVEADRVPWDGSGLLSCVSLRRPLHSYRPITAEADGLFHSPSPLPDGRILVSRRPADGSGTHAVCRLDPRTQHLELVYDDAGFHDIQAKAIAPREEPDGRASGVAESDPYGRLYCLDVYTSDLKGPSGLMPGKVKKVRVIEGLPLKAGEGGAALPGGIAPLALRRILGEVPIAEDRDERGAVVGGSFNLQVPGNTPIQLQLLDENGLALRSCGWIWARRHHGQGCVGCHEDRELAPTNWQVAALWKPSVPVAPPPEKRVAVDFRRDVLPIVTGKCVGCHASGGSPPDLSAARTAELGRRVYELLLAPQDAAASRGPYGKYVHPGRARTSPLVWHLVGRNTSYPWDGASAQAAVKPIPPGQSEALSDREREVFLRWIDLGAPWEGIPAAGHRPAEAGDENRPGR